jgi:hypothetical protein
MPNNGVARPRKPTDYFQHTRITRSNHPIFRDGERCPVTQRLGIPLLIYSKGISQPEGAPRGNEIAVKLRVEAADGFAPERWQHGPGECTVIREDCKPLTRELLETIYSFILSLMSYPIGEEGWAPWEGLLEPANWHMYAKKHYQEQDEAGRQGFDNFFPLVD